MENPEYLQRSRVGVRKLPPTYSLAIALIFGILVLTLLTLVVIPVLYYVAYRRKFEALS